MNLMIKLVLIFDYLRNGLVWRFVGQGMTFRARNPRFYPVDCGKYPLHSCDSKNKLKN